METTVIILLILIVLIAALVLFVMNKSRKGKVNELSEALENLETRLRALSTELGGEKEKLAIILDTIGAGIIILDRERQVTMLNDTAVRLFSSSAEAAMGESFINLTRDHEMDTIVRRCLETNQKQKGLVEPAGGKRYLELTAAPLEHGALILIQDITNIRRLEKVRQDFIVNISHELRTPIASCKAIVETLQSGAMEDKKVAGDFLQRLQVETDKLAQMVNELGELSRIESGELSLKFGPVDIAGVVNKVIERLKAQAERVPITIIPNIPPDLPNVTGDSNRIEQVLVNLVHNAIKFTPQNGEVTVSSEVTGDKVLILVKDTGTGIPEDDLPHIFERFYKVDKARSSGGTGLGLAIAKHIVQAHGGEIWAESEVDRGSTFGFSLPTAGT